MKGFLVPTYRLLGYGMLMTSGGLAWLHWYQEDHDWLSLLVTCIFFVFAFLTINQVAFAKD
jgi:hypothetical protein